MESSNSILYLEFIAIVGVSVASLFLRWKASLSLAVYLFPAYGSTSIAIVLDGVAKSTYQNVVQLFFAFLAMAYALLLVAQVSITLAYEGSIPFDPTLVSEIAFHDEEWLLIALLLVGLLVVGIEITRVVFLFQARTRKNGQAACSCCSSSGDTRVKRK